MNRLVDIPNQILRARKESIVQLARLESYGILLVEEAIDEHVLSPGYN